MSIDVQAASTQVVGALIIAAILGVAGGLWAKREAVYRCLGTRPWAMAGVVSLVVSGATMIAIVVLPLPAKSIIAGELLNHQVVSYTGPMRIYAQAEGDRDYIHFDDYHFESAPFFVASTISSLRVMVDEVTATSAKVGIQVYPNGAQGQPGPVWFIIVPR